MNSPESIKERRDYALGYFQLHANQRMTSFNFFVVIAALLTTALAGTFDKEFEYHLVGAVLGFSLVLIAFIFWKLDERVGYLVKHAEASLKEIETLWLEQDAGTAGNQLRLFSAEEEKTERMRSKHSWNPWAWQLSYATCFGWVYLVFGALGLFGAITALVRWLA